MRRMFLAGLLALAPVAVAAGPQSADFDGARWIWFAGDDARRPPEGTRYFRGELNVPGAGKPKSADLLITCDNLYTVWLNGKTVGESEPGNGAWQHPKRFDVTELVVPGRNVVAVEGINTLPGPAGLLVKLIVRPADGPPVEFCSDERWRSTADAFEDWESPNYVDLSWTGVRTVGDYGCRPWKRLPAATLVRPEPSAPLADPSLTGGVVFLRGNVNKPHHFALNTGGTKQERKTVVLHAYPESDVPAPAVVGRQMYVLAPARPGIQPRLLVDAGGGTLGSPSVSYDGKEVYFAMAPEGEPFYHLFRVPAAGGAAEQLTRGPFHDYDPEPLPDGRLAFSSTRIGSREEYHGNPASSLFLLSADGSTIRPLTYHIVADREPRLTAFGSLVFVRADNFLERAKVETQIHQIHLDGTGGTVLLGNERKPIAYQRSTGNESAIDPPFLRSNGFGSPSPLPDGRVAALSRDGLVLSGLDPGQGFRVITALPLFDIAPVPDGRLVATVYGKKMLAVVEPQSGAAAPFFSSKVADLHSVVYLGPRPRPAEIPSSIESEYEDSRTGYLYCQNVRHTKQIQADVSRIAAVRILEGTPLAIRPDHYPYEHIGVEARELGTVPLAADGSFYARVPADRPLAIQAVDGEGRAVINELSWIYVRPGEQRSCVGCHSPRAGTASMSVVGTASRQRPVDALGKGQPHRFRGNNAETGGILNLQIARMREGASIDLYTQAPLEAARADEPLPPGRPSLVAALCSQLAGSDAHRKVSAMERLTLLHDRSATPALIEALGSIDAEVRMHAALALSACGTAQALPALRAALGDRHPAVVSAAEMALANLIGRKAADASGNLLSAELIVQLSDSEPGRVGPNERGGTPRLGVVLSPRDSLEKTLIAQLSSEDAAQVIAAADALGHVGTPAASGPLQAMVTQHLEPGFARSDVRAMMAAIRALGHLKCHDSLPLLESVLRLDCTRTAGAWARRNVHLAAAAAEALGRIATPEAEKILVSFCARLESFAHYSQTCGDHPVLRESHSSILHYRILEALDSIGTRSPEVIGPLLRSVPGDLDRGLLLVRDSYETLVGRVAQRSGMTRELLQSCLAVLGDDDARHVTTLREELTAYPTPSLAERRETPLEELFRMPRGGLTFLPYTPPMRAAQMISVLMLDARLAPRVAGVFTRYRKQTVAAADYRAVRDRAWVCFYLARALGQVRDPDAAAALLACLHEDPPEAASGRTVPPHPMLFLGVTPFYRSAAAYGLGLSGDPRSVDVLLRVVGDSDNALDVRHSAAQGLFQAAKPEHRAAIAKLAAGYPEVTIGRILQLCCTPAR